MAQSDRIRIELVYASVQRQRLVTMEVVSGTTARDAVLASVLVSEFPAVNFQACPLGIWGRLVPGEQRLHDGDRVEAYRELLRDPREARRELASAGRSMGSVSRENISRDPD